jgi:heme exporter protein D
MFMQWESWSAFFNMGGYAFYVWGSFGATSLCMIWELIALRKRRRVLTQLSVQRSIKWLSEN